jgi:hypothetical protein
MPPSVQVTELQNNIASKKCAPVTKKRFNYRNKALNKERALFYAAFIPRKAFVTLIGMCRLHPGKPTGLGLNASTNEPWSV